MEVICLEEPAFFSLFERVVEHLKVKTNEDGAQWLSTADAMKRLGVKSKATLQSYRDNGEIGFTQPKKKIILYDAKSIDEFLNKHSKGTF